MTSMTPTALVEEVPLQRTGIKTEIDHSLHMMVKVILIVTGMMMMMMIIGQEMGEMTGQRIQDGR